MPHPAQRTFIGGLFFTSMVGFLATSTVPAWPQEAKQKEKSFAVKCVAFSPRGTSLAVAGGWDGMMVPQPPRGGEGFVRVYAVKDILDKHEKAPANALGNVEFTNYVAAVDFRDEDTVVTISHEAKRESKGAPSAGTRIALFSIAQSKEIKRIPLGDCMQSPPALTYHPATDWICYPKTGVAENGTTLKKLGNGVGGKGFPGFGPGFGGAPPGSRGETKFKLDQGPATAYRLFSPDAKVLLTCPPNSKPTLPAITDSLIRLHDTQTGKVIGAFDPDGSFVASAAFSHDGKRLALACHNELVYVLTGDLKPLAHVVKIGARITALAMAPDGQTFAAATAADTVKVFEIDSGKVRHTLEGLTEGINALAYSPDGAYLVAGCGTAKWNGEPVTPGCTRFFDAKAGKLLALLK